MKTSIKVILADDCLTYLEGLKLVLGQLDFLQVTGTATHAAALLEQVQQTTPDVVITNIHLPELDSIETTRILKKQHPKMSVIALTTMAEAAQALDMLEAGANGYLLKNNTHHCIIDATRAVLAGGVYFCPSTFHQILAFLAQNKCRSLLFLKDFTQKELEILQLICQEYSSKQIAALVQLSKRTVDNYRDRLLEKTGAKNMAGLVLFAVQHGIYR